MAPTNGAAGQPAGVRRPAGGHIKPVVPAIPLLYLRRPNKPPPTANPPQPRQTQQTVPLEPLRSEPREVPAQAETEEGQTYDQDKRVQKPALKETKDNNTGVEQDARDQPSTSTVETAQDTSVQAMLADGAANKIEQVASPSTTKANMKESDNPPTGHQSSSATANGKIASPLPTRHPDQPSPAMNGAPHKPSHNHHHVSQSSIGSMRGAAPNHGRFPHMDHVGLYQPHAGNGGVVFGGFHGSNASSPAPYLGSSHGLANVPLTTHIDFPSFPVTGGDGRPMADSPGADSFAHPPLQNQLPQQQYNHCPPTPHSFHGSQSSIQADETMYGRYQLPNGHTGHPGYSLGALPPQMHGLDRQANSRFNVSGGSSSGQIVSRVEVQILDFLRSAIENAEFVDTEMHLYLSTPDDPEPQHADMVMPCHQLILMQSPRLRDMLRTRQSSAGNRLVIQIRNPYIKADSFGYAVRTLYGWDLGDGPLPASQAPRNMEEALALSLEYAASADYLQLPHVYAKAMHHACHQLTWETLERAYHFVLPSAISFRGPTVSSTSNLSNSELLDAIMAFLVHSLPVDFVLDSRADDPCYARLPFVSGTASLRTDSEQHVHSGHGSMGQAQMPRKSRAANPRLSLIQFGDLSMNGTGISSEHSITSAASRQPTRIDTILSRILLNLPFPMLKQVLEHPALAKPSGELSPQKRHEIIVSIIAEREARRAQILDRLDLPELQLFANKLEHATQPLDVHHMGDFMVNNLGFKEEVFPGDVPYLVQRWVHGSDSSSS